MLVYSETTKVFIERVREEIRSLFFLEIESKLPVKFNRSRILFKNYQFPINIVVFEDNSRLGYFDYRHYEIGISKKLMYLAFDQVLRNVIRHELLHYLAYLFYGPDEGHGKNFNDLSRALNWGEEVSSAYSNIQNENLEHLEKANERNKELLNKIKKLLALSSSDNIHESEMATMRANKLLLDYNLRLLNTKNYDEEVYVHRLFTSPKKNAKHLAIYEILRTFFVSPVFNHGKGQFYLEIVGTKENVEIADYVAHFLDQELDRVWNITKLLNPNLKGIVAKNSFFRGVAKGYVEKIKNTQPLEIQNSLSIIAQKQTDQLRLVYSRLGSSSSHSLKENNMAKNLGNEAGKRMSINPAIKTQNTTQLLIK